MTSHRCTARVTVAPPPGDSQPLHSSQLAAVRAAGGGVAVAATAGRRCGRRHLRWGAGRRQRLDVAAGRRAPTSAPEIDGRAVRRVHTRTVANGMRAVVSGTVMDVMDTPSPRGGSAAPRER